MEDFFIAIAKQNKKPALIICDRGIMDNVAYMSEDIKEEFYTTMNWKPIEMRDKRYDAVIHMVTAADGAE